MYWAILCSVSKVIMAGNPTKDVPKISWTVHKNSSYNFGVTNLLLIVGVAFLYPATSAFKKFIVIIDSCQLLF